MLRLKLLLTFLVPLGALCGQDPLQTLPANYHCVLENAFVRVIHVKYAPHEKLRVHDHPKTPTIYVYLTDSGRVRFSHVEEEKFTLVRKPVKAGTFRASPGRVEIHEVENLGDITSEFLRIELRQIPLSFQSDAFRSVKPFDLASSSVSDEFSGPNFRIERIISAGEKAVELPDAGRPSLVVAFESASLISDAGKAVTLPATEVRWISPREYSAVKQRSDAPAHLLRIVFGSSR